MSDCLCWSVLYSPTGDMNLLSEATLFVATKRTPPQGNSLVSSYQALLGVIQNEIPKEKILLFDEGKEVPFKEFSLTKNFVTARGESLNLFAAFSTDSEAKICSQSVELLARGDLFEFKVLSSGNMLVEEKAKEFNLEEEVLSILHDPAFAGLVKEVESLLFQHPKELASVMETLSVK